jgi:hypothetical protein
VDFDDETLPRDQVRERVQLAENGTNALPADEDPVPPESWARTSGLLLRPRPTSHVLCEARATAVDQRDTPS